MGSENLAIIPEPTRDWVEEAKRNHNLAASLASTLRWLYENPKAPEAAKSEFLLAGLDTYDKFKNGGTHAPGA